MHQKRTIGGQRLDRTINAGYPILSLRSIEIDIKNINVIFVVYGRLLWYQLTAVLMMLRLTKIRQTKNIPIFLFRNAPIAQSVEQWSYKPYVAGSSPAGSSRTIFTRIPLLENDYY